MNFAPFITRHILHGFVKLRFVKFSNPSDDHIRLYCYALKSQIDLPRNVIGSDFVLSRSHYGDIPESIPPDATIYSDGLSMDTALIQKIFGSTRPRFIQLRLVPKPPTYVEVREGNQKKLKINETYEVFIDDTDSGVFLNPSPPFFTSN